MSQWDPNDPNNPYNQQQQWGQQPGQPEQGHGQQQQQQGHGQQQGQPQQPRGQQQGHQQQQWGQQQGQPQQPWEQQGHQGHQQQQWGQQQGQPQQPWEQQGHQGHQQQQWGQQPDQSQQYHQQAQQQTYGQQAQQWGGQQPAMQSAGYGGGGYQDAYNQTFGDAADSAPGAVATLGVNERVTFLRKTYAHLFGAIAAFAAIEFIFLWQQSPLFEAFSVPFTKAIWGGHRFLWLAFLGGFVAVGYIAEKWAHSDADNRKKQYMGLGLAVVAWSIIFIPLLTVAQVYQNVYDPGFNIIGISGIVTMAIFAGLTLTVFITKKDFSFMRGALTMISMGAMGLIVASIVFGFTLGIVFCVAMVILAGGYVLYYTSKVLHYYRPGQHVAASLALFGAVALMFWYVVQIVMSLASR